MPSHTLNHLHKYTVNTQLKLISGQVVRDLELLADQTSN